MSHVPSEYIINKIKEFEGCYLKAYYCPANVLTIGYGITNADHAITGTSITENLTISKETAEEWLKQSLIKKYSPLVDKFDNIYHWNQNQFDALLSFVYNIGSLNQLTNNGKRTIQEISNAIPLYNKANKKVLKGLVRRRAFEKELFDKPINGEKQDEQNKNDVPNKKSNEEIAQEVIKGIWGNGQERKENLEKNGYNYEEIQKEVNKFFNNEKNDVPNKKSNEEIAREVIKGLWGNGQERKDNLAKNGYNYEEVQKLVNKILQH